MTAPPCLKRQIWLPPAATVMNCLPSNSELIGGALTPAPQLKCQSFVPVEASPRAKGQLELF